MKTEPSGENRSINQSNIDYCNVRSMRNKLDGLISFPAIENPDITCLTEIFGKRYWKSHELLNK